jgi:hypothetical protein
MNCQIDPQSLKCQLCGEPAFSASVLRNCRPGLGDRAASALSAVGITKARAQAIANAVGVKDCGCRGRQEALNRIGYQIGIGTPPPAESGPTG